MLDEETPTTTTSDNIEISENQEILYAIAKLANRVVDDIALRYVEPVTSRVSDLRKSLDIKKAGDYRGDFLSILAVDSTWTKPFVELVIGNIAVIATGYVITTPACISSHGVSYIALRRGYLEDDSRFSSDVELDAKIMEFLTVEKKTSALVDLVILDGSLFFSTIPDFFNPINVVDIASVKARSSGGKLASLASTALIRMLKKVDGLGIPVVGVVKRVSSRFLLPLIHKLDPGKLEDIAIKTNDKFVLSFVLQPGEYIVLGSYLDILREYLSYITKKFTGYKVRRACRVLEILENCNSSSNALLQELCNFMKNTAVVFYKQISDAIYPQAVRLDVYPKTSVEKVVEYAVHNTSQNSVPIPIDYVDRYIRLESTIIRKIYSLLRAYIKSPEALIALSPTNPQKYYVYESEYGI